MSLTPLATGFCFGAGPRWFEGLLWFSDLLGEAVHTVTLGGSMTTLSLTGHAPSGLGFRPDGSLLIASAERRQILRYDGETVTIVADLTDTVRAGLGDMVIDDVGRVYVGSQAREGAVIVRIDPDDTVTVAAQQLDFPNGMVITADRATLIVAESTGRRLTALASAPAGSCPVAGPSPTGSTDRRTGSRSTPRAACGHR
jgi:sugar lactone lactonase YvrE